MAKSVLSHYSPVLANKYWSQDSEYTCYYRDVHSGELKFEPKGLRQWGRTRGIYSLDVEKSLNEKLETPIAKIYDKVSRFQQLSDGERLRWSQFLMSQMVRTPTYMKYENFILAKRGIATIPDNDRVGCLECMDLASVNQRHWKYIVSHEDDYFVRTDNPIYLTGFLDRPATCLYYPLHPRVCFVACSMDESWDPYGDQSNFATEMSVYELEKGMAWQLNFYMSRSCGNSLIMRNDDKGEHVAFMLEQSLGSYPQPPFSLIDFTDQTDTEEFEYIRKIMSSCDQVDYPIWSVREMEPFT